MLGQTSQLANPMVVTPRHTVLVPVDFSSCSRASLQYAINFTSLINASILVLHVAHETVGESGSYRKNDDGNSVRPIEMIAADMLDEFIDGVKKDLTSTQEVISERRMVVGGLPASRILEVAEGENATCIIMGTQGRKGLSRLSLGSVAEKVVQDSRIPVTVIKDLQVEREKAGSTHTCNS